jgi:hypothetical protein
MDSQAFAWLIARARGNNRRRNIYIPFQQVFSFFI